MIRALFAACFLTLVLLPAARADDRPPGLKSFFADMGLDKIKDLSYQDADGKPISGVAYEKLLAGGASPVISKKMSTGQPVTAVLSVRAKGAPEPVTLPFKIKAGDSFPEFHIADADGAMRDRRSLNGRYTVINTYFAMCGPCVKEVPELNALKAARADINFIGLTFDAPDVTRTFAGETKFSWILLPSSQELLKTLGVNSYPSFILLNRQGKVIAVERHDSIEKRDKSVAGWVTRLVPAS